MLLLNTICIVLYFVFLLTPREGHPKYINDNPFYTKTPFDFYARSWTEQLENQPSTAALTQTYSWCATT